MIEFEQIQTVRISGYQDINLKKHVPDHFSHK
jgi:hypothetical protein